MIRRESYQRHGFFKQGVIYLIWSKYWPKSIKMHSDINLVRLINGSDNLSLVNSARLGYEALIQAYIPMQLCLSFLNTAQASVHKVWTCLSLFAFFERSERADKITLVIAVCRNVFTLKNKIETGEQFISF